MNEPHWWLTKDGDPACLSLFSRHYSRRQSSRSKLFVGPGEKVVLRTDPCDAMWVWRKFKDDAQPPQTGINNAVFRNESIVPSSQLIREACSIADVLWPGERRYTYIDTKKVRSKNPGYCYVVAGWRKCGWTKGGLLILEHLPSEGSGG